MARRKKKHHRSVLEGDGVLERMKIGLRDPRKQLKAICAGEGMIQNRGARFFKLRTGMTMKEFRSQHFDLERVAGIVSGQ